MPSASSTGCAATWLAGSMSIPKGAGCGSASTRSSGEPVRFTGHRPQTQVETYLRVHAYPFLGDRPLGAVRHSEIQAWVKDRSEVLAPESVRIVFRWVATIFKAAVGDRLIPLSPCMNVKLPKKDAAELVPLRVEEVERLAAAMPERYRALIVFDAGMGLRQGECFGLTVDRIDFLRRQVRVDRQLIDVVDGVPTFGPTKSQAGFRTVPMPAVVGDAVSAHLARFRTGANGLVFTNSFGRPPRPHKPKRALTRRTSPATNADRNRTRADIMTKTTTTRTGTRPLAGSDPRS